MSCLLLGDVVFLVELRPSFPVLDKDTEAGTGYGCLRLVYPRQ